MNSPLRKPPGRSSRAFTIIELLIVMTIMTVIGIFAAMAIHNVQDNARVRETQATIQLYEIALESYKDDMGTYPKGVTSEMLGDLSAGSNWTRAGQELWFPNRVKPELDAWGMEFNYTHHDDYDDEEPPDPEDPGRGCERTPGRDDFYNSGRYQIYSMGPNMKTWPNTLAEGGHPRLAGTEPDDIRNWTQETFYDARPPAYDKIPPTAP
jgi:general secretion pathway protein G